MKKLNKIIVLAVFISFILNSCFAVKAQAISEGQTEKLEKTVTTSSKVKDEATSKESTIEPSSDSSENPEIVNSDKNIEVPETVESSDMTSESSSEIHKIEKREYLASKQDSDSYWLVSTEAQLRTYLLEGKKLFRLTNDINLEMVSYKLSNGVVIDGNSFKITYNKAGSYLAGFCLEESNATVTIKNTKFGNVDGSGATGYYGIVTGNSGFSNSTIIFENVIYVSNNGQPLYNPHGKFLFRGENIFVQMGSGSYAQEWAETNYVEIQSGTTTVYHQTTTTDGFIYSYSTAAGNPYKNSSQVVVKKEATFDVQTNHTFLYSSASFAQNITVEENGHLNISQTEATNLVRKRFIYPDLNTYATAKFNFDKNSNVRLDLQAPIQVKAATGSFIVNPNATINMSVASGPTFDITTKNNFKIIIYDPKLADFTGTGQGTFGLLSDNASVDSLAVLTSNKVKVDSYFNSTTWLSNFETKTTILNANGTVYQNIMGEKLTDENLRLLGLSKRLVFTSIKIPMILSTQVNQQTGNSAQLSVTSENYGSSAKEVKYLLFTSLEDTGTLEKAKHIENVTDFEGKDTSNMFTYEHTINGLNPNTKYWFQAMVTNQNGRSELSSPVAFSTKPILNVLYAGSVTTHSVLLFAMLDSDTGIWTDFSNGEENPIKNKQADYGGIYTNLFFEYSKDKNFANYQTIEPVLDGNKNEMFYIELTGLDDNTTYYVRVKGTDVSGEEFILSETPVKEFTTQLEEVIDVEIPIEMVFQTKNKDLGTKDAGEIYSQRDDYQVVNKGTVPVQVSVSDFKKQNVDAETIELTSDSVSLLGKDALSIKLSGLGATTFEADLANVVNENPVLIGNLNTTDQKKIQLDFSGKFFNPLRTMLLPKYQMTLKFEPVK
ncbi:fibronectin type III domain-containing protein [Enterococcus rivorum]|uniref:Fibronectin type-III domain-containing protein n=2 Tax=Enterococcus rivorum TaxID=762845 RepID=A0A1E5KYQ8_9ENTE|nr:fibronectin type III domain-containing protein [Enterococcus rivorum]MBP2097571.1 hypothetical protein [Enterococcus rivorum]OEH83021.1 hypothetical protein BCR26_01755 [Enterococcus rivorum]